MFTRTCTVLALVFAVVSFVAYIDDSGLSNEPVYLIIVALFLLWLPPRLAAFSAKDVQYNRT